MKQTKKLLAFVMSIIMLLSAVPMIYANAATRTVVDSGFCGLEVLNLTWTLYSDGELVIEGDGAMQNYPWGAVEAPWRKYSTDGSKNTIKAITVCEGVTSIGYDAFDFKERRYTKVNLPESLEYIEGYPFDWYDYHNAGNTIAICYAGSQADWEQVEHKNYDYKLNDDGSYKLTYTGSEYRSEYDRIREYDYVKIFFNGEEPQAFCAFADDQATNAKYGEQLTICAFYYAPNGEKVQWRQNGDCADLKFDGNFAYVDATAQGTVELSAVLVDKDGKIVDADTITVTCEYNTLLVIKVFFTDLFNLLVELIGSLL